jgi:hypothetical protein
MSARLGTCHRPLFCIIKLFWLLWSKLLGADGLQGHFVVLGAEPFAVGIRLQPGARRDRLPAGFPGHEEGLCKWELPVCRHVICEAVIRVLLEDSDGMLYLQQPHKSQL